MQLFGSGGSSSSSSAAAAAAAAAAVAEDYSMSSYYDQYSAHPMASRYAGPYGGGPYGPQGKDMVKPPYSYIALIAMAIQVTINFHLLK